MTLAAAAKRTGLTRAEYSDRVAAGLRWCYVCRKWRRIGQFYRSANTTTGYAGLCIRCDANKSRERYYRRKKARLVEEIAILEARRDALASEARAPKGQSATEDQST